MISHHVQGTILYKGGQWCLRYITFAPLLTRSTIDVLCSHYSNFAV